MKSVIGNGSVFSAVLILAITLSIFAAPAEAWNSVRDEVRLFQNFLQNRPRIAAELRANPRLVYDRR